MERLLFEEFISDPRVLKARRLLLEAYKDYQYRVNGIRMPQIERRAHYNDKIERLGRIRGRPLAIPYLGSGMGDGALVELADGSIKYDLISGIGVHFFGHGNPIIIDAAFEASLRDTINIPVDCSF